MKRHLLDLVEIPLAGGRTVHVGMHRGPEPDAEPALLLALAWKDQPFAFGRDALRLPGSIIPELRRVLADLEAARAA